MQKGKKTQTALFFSFIKFRRLKYITSTEDCNKIIVIQVTWEEKRNKPVNLCSNNWSRVPRPVTWITAVAYSRVCSPHNILNDSFKRLLRSHHFCSQTPQVVPKAAFPFLLSLHLWLTLLFTPLQSQQPSCCQPGIHFTWFSHDSLPSFNSSFYYCLIKGNCVF